MSTVDAISSESSGDDFDGMARELVAIGRDFHARGWMLGTSGNLSAVVGNDPLRLAITSSGVEKGNLDPAGILEVDRRGKVVNDRPGTPSAEMRLHVGLADSGVAGAVLHTHSVWSTLVSEKHFQSGGVAIEGYEMLKGLSGVTSHLHREWVPIVENSQDMEELWSRVDAEVRSASIHGVIIHRHGLYTWGRSLAEAHRHVEIFEFLLEVSARNLMMV